MIEIWETISEFPDYEVSSHGRVRRRVASQFNPSKWPAKQMLLSHPFRSGYLHVSLWDGFKYFNRRINRLVCVAFYGPPPTAKHEAAHKDGCRTNNHVDNLYWASRLQNANDRRAHGTHPAGEQNPRAKLNASKVRQIRKLLRFGVSEKYLAAAFNIDHQQIWKVRHNKAWSSVI